MLSPIGTQNTVSGDHSGAIGDPSTVSGNNSYSIGNNNTVSANNTFVLGNDVTMANVDNSVYLGKGSTIATQKGDKTAGTLPLLICVSTQTPKQIEARQTLNSEQFNTESVEKLKARVAQLQTESKAAGLSEGYQNLASSLNAIDTSSETFTDVMKKIEDAAASDARKEVNGQTDTTIEQLKQDNNFIN